MNGFAMLTLILSSALLGWFAATLWYEWDNDDPYLNGYKQGYNDAETDARLDSGQAHGTNPESGSDRRYTPPF